MINGLIPGLVPTESTFLLTVTQAPQRLDTFLSTHFACYSRTFFKKLIDSQGVIINGIIASKPSIMIKIDDSIMVKFPAQALSRDTVSVPDLPVQIVYEHEHFLIINKPPQLSVHAPSSVSQEVTLVDWLISRFQEIKKVGHEDRPGIVHRLDKNTSGLIIISRNNYAHEFLSSSFKNRLIKKTYQAVVKGHPSGQGSIGLPISRHPLHRTKMRSVPGDGRPSVTHYKVLAYFADSALVEFNPVTGRTHQIRVHSAAIGHPIIGDSVYGTSSKLIDRQALHSFSLTFTFEGKEYSFTQELPADFNNLVEQLSLNQK